MKLAYNIRVTANFIMTTNNKYKKKKNKEKDLNKIK